jgi:hypothetical protein
MLKNAWPDGLMVGDIRLYGKIRVRVVSYHYEDVPPEDFVPTTVINTSGKSSSAVLIVRASRLKRTSIFDTL